VDFAPVGALYNKNNTPGKPYESLDRPNSNNPYQP
jgi:hypothetical protein